jgi:hypothetical protein
MYQKDPVSHALSQTKELMNCEVETIPEFGYQALAQ